MSKDLAVTTAKLMNMNLVNYLHACKPLFEFELLFVTLTELSRLLVFYES